MKTIRNIIRRFTIKRRAVTVPFQPFHPEPLRTGAHRVLWQEDNNEVLRAVMETVEGIIAGEVLHLSSVRTEGLPRAAGMLEAYMDVHSRIERMVRTEPAAGAE